MGGTSFVPTAPATLWDSLPESLHHSCFQKPFLPGPLLSPASVLFHWSLGIAALWGVSGCSITCCEPQLLHLYALSCPLPATLIPGKYSVSSSQLPCATHLSPDSCRTSKCIVFSSVSFQILTYMDGTVKVQETYLKNRTGFVYPMPFFNISIAINNTQEMDSGEYMCTVNILDEDTINGKNIGLINLTVLVPPSPPMCQIHGKPYLGGNVTMSCKSSFSKPSPKYTWQRLISSNARLLPWLGVRPAGNVNTQRPCLLSLAPGTDSISAFLFREDAVAPKTPSWGKSSGSDIVSKNGTLSSVHTARDPKLYPSKPASDTASITTAAGSTVGYRPPYNHPRSRTLTPTPSLSSQSLPLYFPPGMNGSHYPSTVPSNRNTLHRTNGAQPQAPRQEPTVPQGLTTSTLTRMGAVPVMVPAQSQAGSLV
uniref:Endothelial cell adhesion molecule n=1 Tax=Chelonoidis abingdonii TaxID=106734 RepID=A0A8C0H444_CHEAB